MRSESFSDFDFDVATSVADDHNDDEDVDDDKDFPACKFVLIRSMG